MDPLIESKTAEAAHAAAIANEALLSALHHRLSATVKDAVREEMDPEKGRYVDLSRVNLICQSIIGIDEKLKEIKENMVTQDQYWPVKTIVYGIVGSILLSVVGAMLLLVVKTQT